MSGPHRKHDKVAPVLAVAMLACAALPVLSSSANRLLPGRAVPWHLVLAGPFMLLPLAPLLLGVWFWQPGGRLGQVLVAIAQAVGLVLLAARAGMVAAALLRISPPGWHVAAGSGFWLLLLLGGLSLRHLLRGLGRLAAGVVLAALVLATWFLMHSGQLDGLGIVEAFAANRGALAAALARHGQLVGLSLALALPPGLLLGLLAQRRAAWRGPVFTTLNLVQTIPSLALFGLLIAPLTAAGLSGIGLVPALIALVLYALLPLARNLAAGLDLVPEATRDAARGLGFSSWGMLWRLDLPLAAPVILAGIRITAVQAVGLAAVAALIGAGGLGAIMFEGLYADTADLVLLGVLPMLALALGIDALLGAVQKAATRAVQR